MSEVITPMSNELTKTKRNVFIAVIAILSISLVYDVYRVYGLYGSDHFACYNKYNNLLFHLAFIFFGLSQLSVKASWKYKLLIALFYIFLIMQFIFLIMGIIDHFGR